MWKNSFIWSKHVLLNIINVMITSFIMNNNVFSETPDKYKYLLIARAASECDHISQTL